jgi:hypothetical protein
VSECEALCRDCSEALSLPCFREAAAEKYIALPPVECQVLRPASPCACIATYSGFATCWQARRGRCVGTVVAEDSAEPLNLKPMCASKIVQCNSMIQKLKQLRISVARSLGSRLASWILSIPTHTGAKKCRTPHICPYLIHPVLTTRPVMRLLNIQKSKVASSPQFHIGDGELRARR